MKMGKFFIIFLVMFALSVFAGSVSALSINGTVDINVSVGTPYQFNVVLRNTAANPIFNVELSGEHTTMSPIDMQPGENATVILTYTATESSVYSEVLEFSSYKKIPCSEAPTSDPFVIEVTETAITPSVIDVCQSREVEFRNLYFDWLTFRVYPDVDFSSQVVSGDSFSRSFSSAGSYSYEVYPLLLSGVVNVNADELLIHSDLDDVNIVLNVVSSYVGTGVGVSSNQDVFSVEHDGVAESFIVVTNTGGEKARSVEVSGEWLSFSENLFDLEPGSSKAVNFFVSPLIMAGEETNMTYNISLVVGGLNFPGSTVNLSVFVPFADIQNSSGSNWWDAYYARKTAFCERFPTSVPECLTEPIVVGDGSAAGSCPDILLNLSSDKMYKYLVDSLKSQSTSEKGYELVKDDLADERVFRYQMVNNTNSTVNSISSIEVEVSELRSTVNSVIVSFVLLLLLGAGGFVGWRFFKLKKRERMNL